MTEEKYQESLYCINCGEDEDLALLGTYAQCDEYRCNNCKETFQIVSVNE